MNFDRTTSKAPAPAHGSASPDESRSHGTYNTTGDESPMLTAAHRENSSSSGSNNSNSSSNNNNNSAPPAFASTPSPFSSAMPSDYHHQTTSSHNTFMGAAPADTYVEDYEMIDDDDEEEEEEEEEEEQERRTLMRNLAVGRVEGQYDGYAEDLDDDDDLRSEDIPSSYVPSSSEDDDPVGRGSDSGRTGGSVRTGGIGSTGGSSPVTRSGSMDVQPSGSRMRRDDGSPDDSGSEADPAMFDTEVLNASSLTLQELQSTSEDQRLPNRDDNGDREASGSNPPAGLPNFTLPTTFRIMYLGQATEQDKQIMFKKVSESLAEAFSENTSFFSSPSSSPAPTSALPVPLTGTQRSSTATAVPRHQASPRLDPTGAFKEKKHHILLLSLLPSSADGDATIDTCEDNGLSIIEADFTGDNMKMGEDYINRQLADRKSTLGNKHLADDGFGGFVYPDETPNGIDLVVYFFAGDVIRELGASYQSDPEEEERIEDDMLLLWRLSKLDVPILVALSSVTTRKGIRVTDEHKDDAIFYTDTMVYPEDVRDDAQVPSGEVSGPVAQGITNPFIFSPSTPMSSLLLTGSARLANRRKEVIDLLARYKVRCFNFTNPALARPSGDRSPAPRTTGEPDADYLWNWHTPCPGRPANLVDHQVYTVPELANMDKRSVYCDLRYARGLGVRAERFRAEARRKNEERDVAKKEALRRWVRVFGVPAGTAIFAIIMLYLGMIIATGGRSGQWQQRGAVHHHDNEIRIPTADVSMRWPGDADWAALPTSLMESLRQRETQQRETQEREASEQLSQPAVLGRIKPGRISLNEKHEHMIVVSTHEKDGTPRITGGEVFKVVVSGGKQASTNSRVVDCGDGKYIVHVGPIVHAGGAEVEVWLAGVQIEGSPVFCPKPAREVIAAKTRQLAIVAVETKDKTKDKTKGETKGETKEAERTVPTGGEEKEGKKKKKESTVAVVMEAPSPAAKENVKAAMAEAEATVTLVMTEKAVHKAVEYWEKVTHKLERAYGIVREEANRGWDRVREATSSEKTSSEKDEGSFAGNLREARNHAIERARMITTRARARSVKIVKNVKEWADMMQGLALGLAQDAYGVVVERIGWE